MIARRQTTLLIACVVLVCATLAADAGGVPGAAPQQAAVRAEDLYMQAEAALAGGDADAALRLLTTIATEYPRAAYPDLSWRAAAGARAGEIEAGRGHDEAAAARFVAVIEGESPSGATARARYGLAETLVQTAEWRAAVVLLESIVAEADAGSDRVDHDVTARARERLAMAHRLWLRPSTGQLPWTRAGRYPAVSGLKRPVGVAAGASGEVLITDAGASVILFIDSSGNTASFAVRDLRRPWWSSAGSAYVATKDGVTAPLRGESYGFSVPQRGQVRALRDLRAGARNVAGEWLLLDHGSDSVVVFGPDGGYLRTLDLGPRGEPVDLALDRRGYAYVIDKSTRTVLFFAPDGTRRGGFGLDTWREPYAVAADGAGHVYVLDRGSKRINVFDPEGGLRWSLGPVLPGGVELRDPRDVAVDAAGRVLIADRGLSSVIIVE